MDTAIRQSRSSACHNAVLMRSRSNDETFQPHPKVPRAAVGAGGKTCFSFPLCALLTSGDRLTAGDLRRPAKCDGRSTGGESRTEGEFLLHKFESCPVPVLGRPSPARPPSYPRGSIIFDRVIEPSLGQSAERRSSGGCSLNATLFGRPVTDQVRPCQYSGIVLRFTRRPFWRRVRRATTVSCQMLRPPLTIDVGSRSLLLEPDGGVSQSG
ncbi:hypothetical protein LX36DRAFT_404983 [Colletotrichum falcatum]|nr:hypothetical protein LX36DRAFT_404983 [Colletotrichum falcatum]